MIERELLFYINVPPELFGFVPGYKGKYYPKNKLAVLTCNNSLGLVDSVRHQPCDPGQVLKQALRENGKYNTRASDKCMKLSRFGFPEYLNFNNFIIMILFKL